MVKIERAKAHLAELRQIVDKLARMSDRLEGEFEPATGDYLFRARRDIGVPRQLPAIIGDIAHNTFAALDYLALELVLANGHIGRTFTAFPIFEDATEYDKQAG